MYIITGLPLEIKQTRETKKQKQIRAAILNGLREQKWFLEKWIIRIMIPHQCIQMNR